LNDAKGKYLQKLGIGHGKYVETLKMFEELSKIAKGLSEEVQSVDEFEKLKHHVVEIHPLATREISIWHSQIFKKVTQNSIRENRMDNFINM
jgi:UTP-glucose-1-phosphate uridylyltransferase